MRKSNQQRRKPLSSVVKGIMLLITLLATAMQVLPLFIMRSSPIENSFLNVAGLLYPWMLIINLLLLFFWLTFGKKVFIIPLAAIISTIGIFGGYFQIFPAPEKEAENTLQVLTYNVKYLGMDYFKNNETNRENIISFLEEQQADIMCMQEFDCAPGTFLKTIDLIKEKTGAKHYVFTRYYPGTDNSERIILLSTKKVINKGSLSDTNNRRYAVYADIINKKDTIRVISCHLQSIYLSEEDNPGLGDFNAKNARKGIIQKKSKRIYSKLAKAYERRAVQSDSLAGFIQNSPYKTILCGDFNDTPSSYTYFSIREHLSDAFREAGKGSGITYGNGFPSFRIDYIFHHPDFKASSHTIHRDIEYSDHYPVTSIIELHNQ